MGAFRFNIFHILGDISHTTSKLILIWAIHSNSSAEGVSLITQVLYMLVFCTRYLDIFWVSATADWGHTWNFVLKIFYIVSSAYIVFLMTRVYARTREREKAWKFGMYCLVGSAILAPIVFAIFRRWIPGTGFNNILWVFSEILESVCVLPQLLLLRQTTVPTVIDSFYLVTLGSYRFLYLLNWIVRGVTDPNYKDPVSWTFGGIQTIFYFDFAWVYWTRQRVKLRQGGVVDSDDLSRGWLISRLMGRKSGDFDEENADLNPSADGHNAAPRSQYKSRWGARGISVSADDDVHDAHKNQDPESQPLADPDAFEDDEDDTPPASSPKQTPEQQQQQHTSGVGNGSEWRDDHDDNHGK